MLKKDLSSGVRATCPPGPPHDFFSASRVSLIPGGCGCFWLKIKFFHDLAYMIGMMLDAEGAEKKFLTFIAHELRTPLNTMAAIELLNPADAPLFQADMLAILRRGYDRLEHFIETALAYFRWQAGEEEGLVDRAAISDLVRVVRSAAADVPDLTTPERELQLALPDVPCLAYGQEQHLTTVVHILLENAVKFSHDEQPIAARAHAVAAHAVLTVTDQGQGLAPELAAALFQPFTISEVMHHTQGTGLHLALADAIVTTYGGHIWASSPGIGHGATFNGGVACRSWQEQDRLLIPLLTRMYNGSGKCWTRGQRSRRRMI